ncbi:hypothetical protein H6P81_012482 [Aristolochia fimbriata]|uniref:Uncharacterized protein n=1 Tax=Aristolochia fimbriata TaxID=158543 RepID=A0AAV7ECH9_ARIFI|nr:hypothetical protein H6P81_012482 [Aristolochia fimbriata]
MRREGRQHGTVRSYMILHPNLNSRPKSRIVNQIDSPPVAGIFVKAPSKPTNHSKFTGKCGKARCTACHAHPACKSRDKAKGTHKVKSKADKVLGLKFATGSSAAGILGLLADRHWEDELDTEQEEEEEEEDYPVQDAEEGIPSSETEEEAIHQDNDRPLDDLSFEEQVSQQHLHSVLNPVEETEMDFHDLGFVLDLMEDVEDWCLIGDF